MVGNGGRKREDGGTGLLDCIGGKIRDTWKKETLGGNYPLNLHSPRQGKEKATWEMEERDKKGAP